MFDRIKREVVRQGTRLATNPKVTKLMSDPRFLDVINRGYEAKNKVQDAATRHVASAFNLVSREELDAVQNKMRQMKKMVTELERKLAQAGSTDQNTN